MIKWEKKQITSSYLITFSKLSFASRNIYFVLLTNWKFDILFAIIQIVCLRILNQFDNKFREFYFSTRKFNIQTKRNGCIYKYIVEVNERSFNLVQTTTKTKTR